MTMTPLECRQVRVAVPGRVLVGALDCTFGSGMFVALLGGNGTGKSLLLRTLAGLRQPDAGSVLLTGQPIAALPRREIARRLGFLPQDPEAAPQGMLAETLLLGRFAHLGLWDAADATDHARVGRALAITGLAPMARRELVTLSGGEQRRAAVARLLVQAPSIYLLDEPTNHLDPAQQLAVLEHFRSLTRDGALVIASLHDPNLALRFADQVCLLAGDGQAAVMSCDAVDAQRLATLYGVPFHEARIGPQRFMAMG